MGPLEGVNVIEIESIGPGPFAAMLLADMGASVLRIRRPGQTPLFGETDLDTVGRGRVSVTADLKTPDGLELVLRAAETADVLIEGMRPGVMERLGLAPDVVMARNPRLVYGRMTGYGQTGPLSGTPGHDVNFISVAGALGAMARAGERPLFPLNLLGDYGGGGMLLAFGIVCAILEARGSGAGQVVDAAMVDGVALLTTLFYGLRAGGLWDDSAGTNVLDSGAHFYEVYETSDGGHIAVGAIEPQFYAALLGVLELTPDEMPQWDRARWPEFKTRMATIFKRRSRTEWERLLDATDTCSTPVMTFADAARHPHNAARGTFVTIDGIEQPAPAPRFSRTKAEVTRRDAKQFLKRWGFSDEEIRPLLEG